MPSGGRRSTSFKPGKSANPGGKPKNPQAKPQAPSEAKKAIADVKAAAKELSHEAISTLKAAMASKEAPWAAKVKAAETILDRGWGRPEQTVTANVSVFDQMTDDEQKTLLAVFAALKVADEDQPTLN